MSLSKVFSAALVSASVAAGSFLPLASAANAGDWNGHRRHGFEHRQFEGGHGGWNNGSFNAHRGYRDGGYRNYAYDGDADYGYRRHRHNTGRDLAIGAFATVLGIALAAEASRTHRDYYEDRD